jgi:hypothetical protein
MLPQADIKQERFNKSVHSNLVAHAHGFRILRIKRLSFKYLLKYIYHEDILGGSIKVNVPANTI